MVSVRRRITIASLSVGVFALGIAVVVALLAPASFCGYRDGTPPTVVTSHWSLATGVVAVGVALVSTLAQPLDRRTLPWVAGGVVLVAAVWALTAVTLPGAYSSCP